MSQQLLDRAGFTGQGGMWDTIVAEQLAWQANATFGSYTIAQAIAASSLSVTDSSSLTIPLLYADLKSAREKMANAAGFNGRANAIWGTANLIEWIFAQVDDQHRPLIAPDPNSIIGLDPQGSTSVNSTFSGAFLNRQPLYEDDNILATTRPTTSKCCSAICTTSLH